MVSIKDIAANCGVSVATVSKALNGQTDISKATRERIRKIAEEMGYTPNYAARSLKTNRSYNLGVLFVDESMSGLTHEYFSHVLDSFKVEAEAHGYDITFINHNIGGRVASYLEHCRYRGVDGVVIACVDFRSEEVMELVEGDLPVVTIDHIFNNKMAVLSDNISGMRELITHAYGKGHRKLAFIHGERTSVTEKRLSSFYKTCAELGLEIPDTYVREGIYHDALSCERITRELLALSDPPTCIFFQDDFSSIGGYNAIADLGLQIPEQISVAGYDGIYLSQLVKPRLTTYKQDTAALGKKAAEQLVNLVERPKTTLPESTVIAGRLIEGDSVKQL